MASSIDPSAVFNNLIEGYVKLPLLQKIIFPLLVAGSVMGIITVSRWANQPDFVVLYSDLSPADSGAVVERLKAQKIKYEVRGDGSTIAVSPPEIVHELRITLASEGVPKGGTVGLEIFDQASLGATNLQEKIKFQRAIQGELERTINSIDAVMTSRVHIVQPEKSVFAKRGAQPTASVLLKLRGGGELSKNQIKGIANLVAGSVEGLARENVTIVDTYGNQLSFSEEGENALGVEATRLQYQREVEQSYVQRVEQMLARVLGPGKVIARVTADLDFSINEREEESFDPGGLVVRSERTSSEGTSSDSKGGVPGVVSNLSNDPGLLAPKGGGAEQNARSEHVKNYEVSKAITRSSLPRGRLMRLSVAVLVDGTPEAPIATGDGKEAQAPTAKPFQPLSPEMLSQIEGVVKSAVGFDASRGDAITVENVPFFSPDSDLAKEMDKRATQDMIFNVIFKAGPILFLVLFFFVIVRPLVRFLITPTEAEVDLTRLLPTGIQELEQELESERSKAQIPVFEPAIDLEQLEELMAENSKIVKENPRQAALMIRYWLNDGRL